MNRSQRILSELSQKYPEARVYDLDGRGEHFLAEVEPVTDHLEYDRAVEVIISSRPHKHLKMTQYYTVISGTLELHVDKEVVMLPPGGSYTVMPGTVHWASSHDEAWVEIYSEPGWTQEDHILVEDSYGNQKQPRIISHPSQALALNAAAQQLSQVLTKLIREDKQILLLLSGGGNIEVAKQVESDLINHQHITRMVLDERFSRNPQLNNSLQLQEVGITMTLTVPEEHETLEVFGRRYANLINTWLQDHPQGVTVCTLGVGADGHIAGISPLPQEPDRFATLFEQTPDLAIGYRGTLEPPARVTVTPACIRQTLDYIVGYVVGDSKTQALESLHQPEVKAYQAPIKLLNDAEGEVVIHTDIKLF